MPDDFTCQGESTKVTLTHNKVNRSIDLMQNDVTRLDAREKCWSNSSHASPGKIKQFKMATVKIFPGQRLLRQAFLTGIKPCDVIMHKVYSTESQNKEDIAEA